MISYVSRTLTKSERNYCVTRKELLGLVYFLRHFRPYLLWRPFLVRTDHAALKWIQQFKEPEGQIARWLEQLQEFNLETEYRAGKNHCNADALSRIQYNQCAICHPKSTNQNFMPSGGLLSYPSSVHEVALTENWWTPTWSNQGLQKKQKTDPVIGTIIAWMEKEQQRPPETMVAGMGRAVRSLWA